MKKSRIVLAALLLALVSLGFRELPGSADSGTDPIPEHPSHAAPRTGAPVPAASGADHPGEVIEFNEGERRAVWFQGVLDEEARVPSLARGRVSTSSGTGVGGDCAALSAQLGLSPEILWRESRCSWDAYNATGCGGRGCRGPAQVDEGHTAAVSPWNPSVPGTCYGLDLSDPEQYRECVSRLPDSAWR